MAFHLDSLLDLRRRAEREAEKLLAAAVTERAKQDEEQKRLEALVVIAHERPRAQQAEPGETRAAEALARERFLERLRDELRAAEAAAVAHRHGALARALAAEDEARAHHLRARQEREAIEKHRDQLAEAARLTARRREEDAASDLALATHGRKPPSRT